MRDPYHEYASEIKRALHRAEKLPADDPDLSNICANVRSDLKDIRQTIRIVEESDPTRFGIDAVELDERRRFVRESERLLDELEDSSRYRDGTLPSASLAWEKQQQQQLLNSQDSTLEQIGTSLSTLRSQAMLIGHETEEQTGMIGELDAHVDSAQTRLTAALGQMDRFVARTDSRLGGWCLWIVVLLFLILLIVVAI